MQKTDREKEFEVLVQQNERLLYKICHLYEPQPGDRDDLYQEMVIQLWKGFDSFRGEAKLSTWVYRVAINTAITRTRKLKNKPSPVSLSNINEVPDNTDHLVAEEQLSILYNAISQLHDLDRALVMLYMEEKTYAEMEDIIGISQATLRVKMNRIKNKLRDLTEKY